MPADQIPTQTPTDEDDYDVWPENHHTVRLFLACETQWRACATMAGMIWIGLDYGAVDVVARSIGVAVNFPDLQRMEGEALRLLNGGAA